MLHKHQEEVAQLQTIQELNPTQHQTQTLIVRLPMTIPDHRAVIHRLEVDPTEEVVEEAVAEDLLVAEEEDNRP